MLIMAMMFCMKKPPLEMFLELINHMLIRLENLIGFLEKIHHSLEVQGNSHPFEGESFLCQVVYSEGLKKVKENLKDMTRLPPKI